MKHRGILLAGLLTLALFSRMGPWGGSAASAAPQDEPTPDAVEDLQTQLAEAGVRLDIEAGLASVPVQVLVRRDLLEYLLVSERGATHESLFVTKVVPSVLNIALLALGVEKGANARFDPVDPPPTPEAIQAGASTHDVVPPAGDGFLLYAAWREGEETYLFRVDDLITNLDTGRSLRRHRWVYLGSRFAKLRSGDEEEGFVADWEGNLINVSFFYQGNTLLTAALPQCVEQTIWVGNHWLLPPFESSVSLIFARRPIHRLPAEWEEALPVVPEPIPDPDDR